MKWADGEKKAVSFFSSSVHMGGWGDRGIRHVRGATSAEKVAVFFCQTMICNMRSVVLDEIPTGRFAV